MRKRNIVALFCEDIREEKNDLISLIGILPDNLNVQPPPGQRIDATSRPILPKISIYIRFNFDPDDDLPTYASRLVLADGHTIELGNLDRSTIVKAQDDAKDKGLQLAGVTVRAGLANIPLTTLGLVRLEIQSGAEIEVIGGVTFNF